MRVLIVAGTLLLLGAGLALAGYDPVLALGAMWRGALGSPDAIASATLVRATPLIIIGLAFALALRAGALNIGAEGQFYAGAIAAAWIGVRAGDWPSLAAIPAMWLAAFAAGMLWVLVPVILRARFGVFEVISTLLLNFVAEALVSLMVQGPMQERTGIYPQSDPIAAAARLPLLPGTRLHLGFALAVALALVFAWYFARTLPGFRLRAVGLGARAAEITGRINVKRTASAALLASGGIAALAGAAEVGGVSYALYANLSPGYGFTAIAVALLARLNPAGIILTGILFGALEAGAAGMQRDAGVPAVIVYVVEAVVIIALLLLDVSSRRRAALRALAPETAAA